jgi:hypothetical protein
MKTTRWIALWKEQDRERVYIFHSSESLINARIDFQLRLLDQGDRVPKSYTFEESNMPVRLADTQGYKRNQRGIGKIHLKGGDLCVRTG